MICHDNIHEKESFEIRFGEPIDGKSLITFFESIGARSEDEFFFEVRKEHVPPWQASSFYTASCRLSGAYIYPDESGTDCVVFDYLFCSLPTECFERFAEILQKTAERFCGSIHHSGRVIAPEDLCAILDGWVKDLEEEISERPGTESLAILVQELFYQR